MSNGLLRPWVHEKGSHYLYLLRVMAPQITSDEIRNAEFRTTLRGLDRSEVEAVLQAAAARLEQLEEEAEKLRARAAEMPSNDLEAEFEEVGKEVTSILQVAREAADSMRERANLDAARWRREATEEADKARREAAADAEAMRRDAWVTGTELLEQAQETAEAMRAGAERDVLTVMGEAEREAHRLTSGARREAEDLVRNANMEAEKIVADATTRRDEIIDGANRQAAAAQERTRALENRRDELLEELENVRSTLTKLEGSLEERREALDLSREPDPSVRVVHSPADAKEDWEVGETVRVVRPEDRHKHDPNAEMADEMSSQVARIQDPGTEVDPRLRAKRQPAPGAEPEPAPVAPDVEAETEARPAPDPLADVEPETGSEPGEASPPEEPSEAPEDDLEAIFASLRGGGDTSAPSGEEATVEGVEASSGDGDISVQEQGEGSDEAGTDWIAVRDSRLLPITNRALRGVKKAIAEVQNVALDSLRSDDDWVPDEKTISEALHAELVAVWSESFAVGHAVAEEMEGEKLKRPKTPQPTAEDEFASDLVAAVVSALGDAGDGPRERQSAASRVFRVWRSDEAERRIRDIALRAYELGVEKSRSVPTG